MHPVKSLFLGFQYSKVKLDVSLWPASEKEGKVLPQSISLRLRQGRDADAKGKQAGGLGSAADGQSGLSVYMKASDALKVASVLQAYAFLALEEDSRQRLENWKKDQAAKAVSVEA